MKPNMLLNIVSVALLLIAVVGLAVHEEPEPVIPEKLLNRKYEVIWVINKIVGKSATGETRDENTDEGYIEINITNMTEVRFTISTSDSHPFSRMSPAKTTVKIISPNDREESVEIEGTSTEVIVFNISSHPNISEIYGKSEDDALKKVEYEYPPTENETGSWYYSISIERDYISPVGIISGSVSWKVDVEIEAYHAEIGGKI